MMILFTSAKGAFESFSGGNPLKPVWGEPYYYIIHIRYTVISYCCYLGFELLNVVFTYSTSDSEELLSSSLQIKRTIVKLWNAWFLETKNEH